MTVETEDERHGRVSVTKTEMSRDRNRMLPGQRRCLFSRWLLPSSPFSPAPLLPFLSPPSSLRPHVDRIPTTAFPTGESGK